MSNTCGGAHDPLWASRGGSFVYKIKLLIFVSSAWHEVAQGSLAVLDGIFLGSSVLEVSVLDP